ncbi:MAG: ATP-binding domain-containing protein [Eubacterium ventriosum]
MELAYAVTIHKSQGSEYPAVVMPLVSGASML